VISRRDKNGPTLESIRDNHKLLHGIRNFLATVLCVVVARGPLLADEPVRATIEQETAWTGEAVSLVVMLYSPGPFDGAAAFDLPELPLMVISRTGSPVVGSEQIDGTTYFTQRHEFSLYTQRVGRIVIPPFRVRFSAKASFTSEAEPVEGLTVELEFESKRPPGTDRSEVVVAAKKYELKQSWSPEQIESVVAGDVIQRSISRTVAGTTAMLLPPVPDESPSGVKLYQDAPVVEDKTDRGQATAVRREVLKYQFGTPGTYELPDVTFQWWDPESGELRTEAVPGRVINVTAPVTVAESNSTDLPRRKPWIVIVGVIIGLCLTAWGFREQLCEPISKWISDLETPESRAARRLLNACRNDQPSGACIALIDWKSAVTAGGTGNSFQELLDKQCPDFNWQSEELVRRVYGASEPGDEWSGQSLATSFRQAGTLLNRSGNIRHSQSALPPLNPPCANETV